MALGLFSKTYNRWENNIVQTAGTTAGQIAFLCWLLAAFDILAAEPGSGFDVHLTRMQTFVWLSAAGLLGVLLAVPLRKHFIEDENLPFPEDRKSTRLNSSHLGISYAVFCLKKKKKHN